eukprot:10724222-Prorocentrum_lima.AAC.1
MSSAAPGGAGRSDRVEICLAQATLQSFGEVGRGGYERRFVSCARHAELQPVEDHLRKPHSRQRARATGQLC